MTQGVIIHDNEELDIFYYNSTEDIHQMLHEQLCCRRLRQYDKYGYRLRIYFRYTPRDNDHFNEVGSHVLGGRCFEGPALIVDKHLDFTLNDLGRLEDIISQELKLGLTVRYDHYAELREQDEKEEEEEKRKDENNWELHSFL